MRSVFVTIFVTALIVLAIVDGPLHWLARSVFGGANWTGFAEFFARTTLAEAAVLIMILSIVKDKRTAKKRRTAILNRSNRVGRVSPDERFGRDPSPRHIRDAARVTQSRYFDSAIGLFSLMLIEPAYLTRTVESFSVRRGHARKTTRIEYVIGAAEKDAVLARALEPIGGADEFDDETSDSEPASDSQVTESDEELDSRPSQPSLANPQSAILVVPVALVKKGTLLPGLRLSDHAGNRLYELSQDETLGLTSIALSSYFSLAFSNVIDEDREEVFAPEADKALWRLRQIISYRGVVTIKQIEDEFDRATQALEIGDSEKYDALRRFCLFFADSYYMACEVSLPDGFSVVIEMSTDVSVEAENSSREQRLRSFFSMEPYRYHIPLDLVSTSSNYHAELESGEHPQYVYRQQVETEDGTPIDDGYFLADEARQGQVIYQSEPTRVAPRINIRNFFDPQAKGVFWNVSTEELPPGAYAPVLSLSLLTTLVATCFAFIVPKIAGENFDGPALIVAIPLFIATFFGFSFDRLARSSLQAVYGFIVSATLIVICAILVLVSGAMGPGIARDPSLFGGLKLPPFSWPLIVCALISLVVNVNLSFLLYRRVQRYVTLAKRDDARPQSGSETES